MRYRILGIAGVACLMAGCSQSMEDLGGKPNPSLVKMDNDFFKTITVSNETELESSRLALTQSQSEAVKSFAQHMIDDHTMAGAKVSALAAEKGVMLPSKMDSTHQQLVDDLKTKSGSDFDKAYVQLQVTAHKETIDADQDEANNGTDPAVKTLAGNLLPTLQHHLTMAQELQNQPM